MTHDEIRRHAVLSSCKKYRYLLTRWWGDSDPSRNRFLTFVMLNPSTVDAMVDDPTIRRCMGFAVNEGMDGIAVVNIFPYRTKSPKILAEVRKNGAVSTLGEPRWQDGVSPRDFWIKQAIAMSPLPPVAAWGASKEVGAHHLLVMDLAPAWTCLGTNADGSPKHPLYVRADQPLIPFVAP